MHPTLIALALTLAVAVLTIILVQHLRYLHMRRVLAQDRQFSLHSTEVFHVLVFFKVKGGTRVRDSVRALVERTTTDRTRLIYAGQAAFTAPSEQLDHDSFDGVALLQYPSRFDYEENGGRILSDAVQALFSSSYVHGMRRNRRSGLMLPQWLLRLRVAQLLRGRWRRTVLTIQPDYPTSPRYDSWRKRVDRLRAMHQVNPAGLVTVNLIKRGNARQQAADDQFSEAMLSLMATDGCGPMHVGRCVALEGNARFNDAYLAYYPSAEYFADLVTSQFFHSYWSSNNVGDSLWLATVPLTDSLN